MSKVSAPNIRQALLLSLGSLLLTPAALAQSNDYPWFEIEVIAFERGSLNTQLEKFNPHVSPIAVAGSLDLLKPLYQPDVRSLNTAIPDCRPAVDSTLAPELQVQAEPGDAADVVIDEVTLAQRLLRTFAGVFPAEPLLYWPSLCKPPLPAPAPLSLQLPTLLPEAEPLPGPAMLPVIPQVSGQHQQAPYLLDETALQLKDLAWQLSRRAGHTLLLHTGWRQMLGPKRTTRALRLFAGQRFSPSFDYLGQPVQPQTTLSVDDNALQQAIADTYQRLQNNQPLGEQTANQLPAGLPDQVWQLDGLIQPYNERMLFADTEFNLRQRSADGQQLLTFYAKDNVRLLLGELHYLDHPRFGLILQIRRFTPPASESTPATAAAQGTNP